MHYSFFTILGGLVLVKDKMISLKIPNEWYQNCKDFDIPLIKCFEDGYFQNMENFKEKIDEIVEKTHNEYIRVYTIKQKFIND